ncbi:MAG: right-handed parallel beta-helix repeat-containing protein, partial [Myxococcota bacterium]
MRQKLQSLAQTHRPNTSSRHHDSCTPASGDCGSDPEAEHSCNGQSKQASEVNDPNIIENITLSGLHFHGTDWIPHSGVNLEVDHNLPPNSKPLGASVQGAFDACSTIYLEHATQATIKECKFSHLGSHAITIGEGCRKITIRHNRFEELGGSALIAHGSELDGSPANQTKQIQFTDNVCIGLGRTFPSSCGVLGGAVREMTIAHNVIRDLFYSGISLGWSWGYADTISQNHLVEFNLIEDVSQGLLNDLGGIYLVGQNTGSIIRRNIVRRVKTANFG